MTIKQILEELAPGKRVSIANNRFVCGGLMQVTLEGGEVRHWIFNANSGMLSVAPADEELILFEAVDEEVEPDDDTILFRNKEYEFSYEDVGTISNLEGEAVGEEEDQITIADYEADDGEIMRLVTNQNTGTQSAYVGERVVEDDVTEV